MEYAALVELYRELDATDSNLEKTAILADVFAEADETHLPLLVTLCRGEAFPARESAELGISSKLTREAISKATGIGEGEIEDAWRETGDLGDAAAWAVSERTQQALVPTTLDVETVHATLEGIAGYRGEGSQGRRIDAVSRLLSDADPEEARYLVRTVLGHLRVGVGSGTIRDALAEAFLDGEEADRAAIERAYQLTSDYRIVAETARNGGREGLRELSIELFRPIDLMLAEKSEGIAEAIRDVAGEGEAVLWEYKYDGIRVQIHKRGEEVRVFTRRLEEITAAFPEAVSAVEQSVSAESALLDAELVGYDRETERPVAFQQLSRRVRRKYDVEELSEEVPTTLHVFDLLFCEGRSLLDEPLSERLSRLDPLLSDREGIEHAERLRSHEEERAHEFYEEALAAGHEGVMAKNAAASYQPGRRVGHMVKVKPAMEPLDLVVTRAQWSEGRRSDYLGRLFLGCYDPDTDTYPEVGRLSTGYTDEELAELTALLEPLVTGIEGRRVSLRPELVLEIEYEEIQNSPEYDSGFALRFPRFLRRRDDLAPADADTLSRVEALYEGQ
ncbi:ATP-dependent DNA ligase [Natronorarus salvus]|uniref:ATP-dependent DNA ligase n=1 Tax=Natronorarus salvus TaxID=3117733 RepID=UPI002F269D04